MPANHQSPWASFRLATAFLTRLPLDVGEARPGALARSMPAFPLVGALIGLAGGLVYWIAAPPLPPVVGAVLAVLAVVWLTGGLHEDGLADTADGFGGGHDFARRLEIMRDSRTGSYGVLAIVFAIALRVFCVSSLLTPEDVLAALLAAESVSRACIPLAMSLSSPARRDGLGAGAGTVEPRQVSWALGLGFLIALVFLGLVAGATVLAAAIFATVIASRLAENRIGGYTGDVLGAVQQAALVAALLAATALA